MTFKGHPDKFKTVSLLCFEIFVLQLVSSRVDMAFSYCYHIIYDSCKRIQPYALTYRLSVNNFN